MKRQTYIGILALTIVAASFSACSKTVYVPESEYNEIQNEKKSKKKETNVEETKKGKKDKNKQIISRPGNKGTESVSEHKAVHSSQKQATPTKVSQPNNIYEVVTLTSSTPADQSSDILVTAKRIKENNNNAPLAARINNQYINSSPNYEEPKTDVVNEISTTKTSISSNPKPQSSNKPAPKAKAKVETNMNYHYGKRVAVSLKNGARWDGTIKEHASDASKVIIVLVDGNQYPTAKKDIQKIELKK